MSVRALRAVPALTVPAQHPKASLDPCTWTEESHFSSAWALGPCPSAAVGAPGLSPISVPFPGQTLDPGCSHVSSSILVSCCLMEPSPGRPLAVPMAVCRPCYSTWLCPLWSDAEGRCLSVRALGSLGSPRAPKSPSPSGGGSQPLLHPDSDRDAP